LIESPFSRQPGHTGVQKERRRIVGEDEPPRTAEYQDGDVSVLSRSPLLGTLELVGDNDEPIDLQLDRERAEELVSVLLAFLLAGEGEDSPNATFHSEH
jgi:hypothetical protein